MLITYFIIFPQRGSLLENLIVQLEGHEFDNFRGPEMNRWTHSLAGTIKTKIQLNNPTFKIQFKNIFGEEND